MPSGEGRRPRVRPSMTWNNPSVDVDWHGPIHWWLRRHAVGAQAASSGSGPLHMLSEMPRRASLIAASAKEGGLTEKLLYVAFERLYLVSGDQRQPHRRGVGVGPAVGPIPRRRKEKTSECRSYSSRNTGLQIRWRVPFQARLCRLVLILACARSVRRARACSVLASSPARKRGSRANRKPKVTTGSAARRWECP